MPIRPYAQYLTLIVGGSLMALAPEPIGAWGWAWVALIPLWWSGVRPAQSAWPRFWQGCLWSGMYHGLVLSWLWHLHPLTWMGVPWLASVAIALFAWSFVTGLGSVTFGLWAVGLGLISDRLQLGAFGRILVGTAMWCLLETVLSWGPLAWPFLSFTQSPGNLWILHLGQIGGPLLITAVIVAVNGCWAELLRVRSDEQGQGRSLALVGLLLLLGSHGCGWALSNRPLAENPAQSLRIGLIQGNIPTHIKLTPAGTRLAIARYLQGYQTLVAQGADAVLTPEGALPEIWNQRTQNRSPVQQAVVTAGRPLWLGTFRPVTPDSPQRLYQSLVTLDSQGQMVGQYNKVKLVPLGEYIPFEAILGKIISRLSPVSSSLQAGDPNQVLTTPFGRAIAGICYESAYSELFRRQAAQGGEWIMTASNNDPYPPRMMRQHHAHDVMRAIESDRWAVRVTNTGISGIVTPHGNTLWLATPNTYITHLADITRRQTVTPYVRYGNRVPAILIGLAVIAGLIGHLRSTHILAERDKPL